MLQLYYALYYHCGKRQLNFCSPHTDEVVENYYTRKISFKYRFQFPSLLAAGGTTIINFCNNIVFLATIFSQVIDMHTNQLIYDVVHIPRRLFWAAENSKQKYNELIFTLIIKIHKCYCKTHSTIVTSLVQWHKIDFCYI